MTIVRVIMSAIEYINFRYSFFNFQLKGWSEEAMKKLEKDRYIITKFFNDFYNKVNTKITGK
jgi:hypothetical protein